MSLTPRLRRLGWALSATLGLWSADPALAAGDEAPAVPPATGAISAPALPGLPRPAPVAADEAQPASAPPTGAVTGRQPLPPAPRGSRSFRRCYQEAINRRLRGAERRHFVASCRLGYGHRLFRGRGTPPASGAPSVPGALPPT